MNDAVSGSVSGTDKRGFSSFPDLLNHVIGMGAAKSWEDVVANRPHLIHDIVFEWYRQGQIACQYAVHLAHTPEPANWLSEIVSPGFDPRDLDERIDAVAGRCEALQLIFLGVTRAEHAAELIVTLCERERWSCYEGAWDYSEEGGCIPVALRWNPLGGTYTSWVLGVAPFAPMPFTRRFVDAPFTTLVFRPAPPTRLRTKRDPVLGRAAAHLAHMNDLCGEDHRLRRVLESTTKLERRKLLTGDFKSLARAQVTFALPNSCRDLVAPVLKGKATPKRKKQKK